MFYGPAGRQTWSEKVNVKPYYYHSFTVKLFWTMSLSNRCNTSNEFEAYAMLNYKIYESNETEIFTVTGCLSSCDKYAYTIQPLTALRASMKDSTHGLALTTTLDNKFTMKFVIPTGSHEQKEQVHMALIILNITRKECFNFKYMIYDWNSLLADMGGYIGLLLGQSVFGVYQLMASWMNSTKVSQLLETRNRPTKSPSKEVTIVTTSKSVGQPNDSVIYVED